MVTTCAPLHVKKLTTILTRNHTSQALQDYSSELQYRPLSTNTAAVITNYTFCYNPQAIIENIEYSLNAVEALAQYPGNAWDPIPAVNRTEAEVSIIMITLTSMRFAAPNNRPVFGAHELSSCFDHQGRNYTWYSPQYYVSIIACGEQHQICNRNNGACTPLVGTTPLLPQSLAPEVGLNVIQQGTMERISVVLRYTSVYQTVQPQKDSALRAQETATDLEQAPIPDNQLIIGVGH